jgi:hypothetical protein
MRNAARVGLALLAMTSYIAGVFVLMYVWGQYGLLWTFVVAMAGGFLFGIVINGQKLRDKIREIRSWKLDGTN